MARAGLWFPRCRIRGAGSRMRPGATGSPMSEFPARGLLDLPGAWCCGAGTALRLSAVAGGSAEPDARSPAQRENLEELPPVGGRQIKELIAFSGKHRADCVERKSFGLLG